MYLNGFKHGFGSKFDCFSGRLIYEGEFLNGKEHGPGIEYDDVGNVLYKGQFINGERASSKYIIF